MVCSESCEASDCVLTILQIFRKLLKSTLIGACTENLYEL